MPATPDAPRCFIDPTRICLSSCNFYQDAVALNEIYARAKQITGVKVGLSSMKSVDVASIMFTSGEDPMQCDLVKNGTIPPPLISPTGTDTLVQ